MHAVSLQPNDPPLHSMFNGANWSPPDQLPTADIVELLRIAVTGGNTLHVVWTVKTAQPFTVWYMQGKTTAPAVPFQPVPAPPPAASANPAASQAEATAEPGTGLSPRAADIPHDYRPVARMTPGNLVLLGVVPALLALVIIFAIRIAQIRWPKEY
ncbi:MAG: hypothetical protein D6784_10210 [Chloroflexi bacterium]|nr:MAG: hypothetical protein D6784_10210 [Chloroflexota bacterium]